MNMTVEKLHDATNTLAGITLALTPLAMWVAPNELVFATVLAISVVSGFAVWLLSYRTTTAEEILRGNASAHGPPLLPDRFIAELHKLSPLTYHHRGLGDGLYQRKIDALKKHLDC
jgi:hypothetical protein